MIYGPRFDSPAYRPWCIWYACISISGDPVGLQIGQCFVFEIFCSRSTHTHCWAFELLFCFTWLRLLLVKMFCEKYFMKVIAHKPTYTVPFHQCWFNVHCGERVFTANWRHFISVYDNIFITICECIIISFFFKKKTFCCYSFIGYKHFMRSKVVSLNFAFRFHLESDPLLSFIFNHCFPSTPLGLFASTRTMVLIKSLF